MEKAAENHNQVIDIAVLCHNAQTLVSLTKPLAQFFVAVDKFSKWESPILCILVLVLTTLISLIMPSCYLLLANLTLLGTVAGIGIAHLKGNILLKVLPSPIVTDTRGNYLGDLPEAEQHSELMTQFKEIIHHTDKIVLKITQAMEKFYSLIKWEDFNHTSRFYSIAALMLIIFHMLPMRWTVTLVINGFVLYYPVKKYIIQKYFQDPKHVPRLKDDNEAASGSDKGTDTISVSQVSVLPYDDDGDEDVYSENSSTEMSDTEGMEFGGEQDQIDCNHDNLKSSNSVELPRDEIENSTEVVSKDDELDHLGPGEADDNPAEIDTQNFDVIRKSEVQQSRTELRCTAEGNESTGSDTGSVESHRLGSSPSRPTGVVGRLMEFKRKQQQANTGTCVGCRTNFSTILKRKRNCNYCGNSFCSKCCSFKVSKSVLGVTAPGSQTEQVVVCQDCHGYLTFSDKDL